MSWSPEGGHIWKRAADGQGQPERLTRAGAFYSEPVWTPDGKRIVALRAPRQTGWRSLWSRERCSTSSGFPPKGATPP